MHIFYYFFLLSFGALTIVASIPNMALMFALYTFGLGAFLLIAAVNLFVFLLCLLPLSLSSRPTSFRLTFLLLVTCLIGPGLVSEIAERRIKNFEQADDVQSKATFSEASFIGIELIRPQQANANFHTRLIPQELCGVFCQRLLHGGQVDWIRVITTSGKKKIPNTISTVRRGDAEGCEETHCFLFVENTENDAGVTVRIKQDYYGPYDVTAGGSGLSKLRGRLELTVLKGSEKTENVAWKQTYLQTIKIGKPAYLMPNFSGFSSGGNNGGLSISRILSTNDPINAEAIAADLGLKLAPPLTQKRRKGWDKPRPLPSDAATIASALDQSERIGALFKGEISYWIKSLNKADKLSHAEIHLLMRLANDPRFLDPSYIPGIFVRFEELQEIMLPWVFDRLEENSSKRTPKSKFVDRLTSAFESEHFSTEKLSPYAHRYQKLLKGRYRFLLMKSVGKFGFDPTPTLSEIFYKGTKRQYLLANAICNSAPEWKPKLLSLARDIAKSHADARRTLKKCIL